VTLYVSGDQQRQIATPILVPRIGCGGHKEVAVNDFVALVVVEPVVFLVGPTLGLFFQHRCHETKVANKLIGGQLKVSVPALFLACPACRRFPDVLGDGASLTPVTCFIAPDKGNWSVTAMPPTTVST